MAGREVREYTNLSDPKGETFDWFGFWVGFSINPFELCSFLGLFVADKKLGKGKIDDEDVTFQRMVAKVSASPSLSVLLT